MQRKKPLQARTPLRSNKPLKRSGKPLRARRAAVAGGSGSGALERAHVNRVAHLGCLVCGQAATVHHVTARADAPGRFGRTDRRVVPLCPMHHQKVHDPKASDPVSVEGLGHQGFFTKFGIDLWAVAERLWEETKCGRG